MGAISRVLAFFVMGAVAWITVATPIAMIRAASAASGGDAMTYILPFLIVALVAAVLVSAAPTSRQAWGRMALLNGLACFALPFMSVAFSAAVGSHIVPELQAAGAAAGVAVAGVALAGVTGLFGFFAGMILIVIAYFVLKSRPATV